MLDIISIENFVELYPKNEVSQDKIPELLHMPYLDYFEKVNTDSIILSNGILQVLIGISYYNRLFPEAPITLNFRERVSIAEFISMPTIQLFTSVFKFVRPIGVDNLVYGIWAKELLPNVVESYKRLVEENKTDICMRTLFRDFDESFEISGTEKTVVYELISDECKTPKNVTSDIVTNKIFTYLISESFRNKGMVGIPLFGWTLQEIENCEYIHELKKIFRRVFLLGSGNEWKSTNLFVFNQIEDIFNCSHIQVKSIVQF